MSTFIRLLLFLVLSFSQSAVFGEDVNKYSPEEKDYCFLGALSVAEDNGLPEAYRLRAFDSALRHLREAPSGWMPFKTHLLRLAAYDPDFLVRLYDHHPKVLEKWLENLNLRWYREDPSPYPALRTRALASLASRRNKAPGPAGDFMQRLRARLEAVQPGRID